MKSHTLRFQRKPKVKGRPRLGRRGRVYTPPDTLEWEQALAAAWDGPTFEGPVEVAIDFDKDEVVITITELDQERSKLRGDIDNYIKAVLDGLNKHAYLDDKQVVVLASRKVW